MDWVDQVQYSWLGGTDNTVMKATRTTSLRVVAQTGPTSRTSG